MEILARVAPRRVACTPQMSGLVDADQLRRRRVPLAVGAAFVLLALVEATTALLAPRGAPTDDDWRAAAAEVRAGFKPGDLIVAAPAWADQVMRLHLGDLVPAKVAGRLDAARFGRVWELAQRGGRAPEAADGKIVQERRHGALTLRLSERTAAQVTYDFVDRWQEARLLRGAGGVETECARHADRHQCMDLGAPQVMPRILEIGNALRSALLAPPVAGATVVVEWPAVTLGRELAVGAGLHHVWRRKLPGTVQLRVLVGGQELARDEATNRSGWRVRRYDTTAHQGKTLPVRFEITSAEPLERQLGFAAEARR